MPAQTRRQVRDVNEPKKPGTEGFALTVAQQVCIQAGVGQDDKPKAETLAMLTPGLKPHNMNSRRKNTPCSDVTKLLNERLHVHQEFWNSQGVVRYLSGIVRERGVKPSTFYIMNKSDRQDPYITHLGAIELLCHPIYASGDQVRQRDFILRLVPMLTEKTQNETQRFQSYKEKKSQGRGQRDDLWKQRDFALAQTGGQRLKHYGRSLDNKAYKNMFGGKMAKDAAQVCGVMKGSGTWFDQLSVHGQLAHNNQTQAQLFAGLETHAVHGSFHGQNYEERKSTFVEFTESRQARINEASQIPFCERGSILGDVMLFARARIPEGTEIPEPFKAFGFIEEVVATPAHRIA
ncbi:hypothetical protein CYMTET_50602 [Cymbomonas tetramitiformis]|uniref:Uncharacterized protein n=1 Tax=Cymbomonas tetramitiformis TaxID=36881 RepID=A0AAE0BNY6_9CHLO|nr:hypothetical protein CYMTET_50602 [Cymbomonas tetramitiformis]